MRFDARPQIKERRQRDQQRGVAPGSLSPFVSREEHIVQHHHGRQNRRALLRKNADGLRDDEPAQPRRAFASQCRGRADVAQQSRDHSEGRQQIRAPDDVGHRFGKQRMNRPDRRHRERRRKLGEDGESQDVDQRGVQLMQRQVDRMIAGRTGFLAQDRVVEQVRERRQRAIQTRVCGRIPIFPCEDQPEIFRGRGADARIVFENRSVIEYQRAVE